MNHNHELPLLLIKYLMQAGRPADFTSIYSAVQMQNAVNAHADIAFCLCTAELYEETLKLKQLLP